MSLPFESGGVNVSGVLLFLTTWASLVVFVPPALWLIVVPETTVEIRDLNMCTQGRLMKQSLFGGDRRVRRRIRKENT